MVAVPSQTPQASAKGVGIEQKPGSQVPLTAHFKDADGRSVQFGEELPNRPAVVLPIFYRCKGVCQMETDDLLVALPKLNKRVGKDFDVIVLSVDPQEGPDLAKDKKQSSIASNPAFKGTDQGWHFLTGSIDQIRSVTDAMGFFFSYDPKLDIINHPSGVMFLTPQGRVSSYILNARFTKGDLERNLSQAAVNTIGEKVPDSFFGCIHTDPVTGQKSLNIMRFLSLFAFVFLVALAGLLFYLSKVTKRLAGGVVPPQSKLP
jgi:protein SCO1/2